MQFFRNISAAVTSWLSTAFGSLTGSRSRTVADFERDLATLAEDVQARVDRNNDQANAMENTIAALQARIEELDNETINLEVIRDGARALTGGA